MCRAIGLLFVLTALYLVITMILDYVSRLLRAVGAKAPPCFKVTLAAACGIGYAVILGL